MRERLVPLASLVTPFDIFRRWKLSRDEQAAVKIDKELQRAGLPPDPLEQLLVLGEAVAEAHKQQVEWSRDAGARYRKLANLALDAGKLATQLRELIPQPWGGDRQVIGALVASLEDFCFCGVEVTTFAQHIETINAAQFAYAQLRKYLPKSRGRVSDALVGRLAWLASNPDPDLRPRELLQRGAMRPYRGVNMAQGTGWKKPQGTPARATWRRKMDILRSVTAGASGKRRRAFTAPLETWLKAN